MNCTSPLDSFVLHIERGRTDFPERPINAERFLIGAGSNCHLQLGGEFPILHSIVIPRDEDLWIDAVVPAPLLIVNGRPVRESLLQRGDVIEIGEFVFTVGKREPAEPNALESIDEPLPAGELTAAELVDHLEAEMSGFEELDQARELGARALLQAARAAAPPVDVQQEREDTIRELLLELQQRSEELNRRERILNDYAARLERTQQEIRDQLRALEARLAAESDDNAELRLTA